MSFSSLYFFAFWIGFNLFHNLFDLFQFKVDDVIHDALSQTNVLLEQVEIEVGILGKRIDYVGIKVDSQQAARIVWAKWNFTTWVGRNRTIAKVSIAIWH